MFQKKKKLIIQTTYDTPYHNLTFPLTPITFWYRKKLSIAIDTFIVIRNQTF